MKKTLNILCVGALVCASGCTDILDTAPYNQVASENMWLTENLTDMGVNGVYSALRNNGPDYYAVFNTGTANNNGIGEWAYDVLGPLGTVANSDNGGLLNGNMSPDNGSVNNLWKNLYEGVHRANDAIANIPAKSPCSAEKKARLVAECRFLRAFFYYRLNELWRGVPYYDVPIKVEECTKGQETEEVIWQKVIDDLTAVINEPNLPKIDHAAGRITRGAAYALRGKTYMQLGANGDYSAWDKAIADFDSVGNCGYQLFAGNYKDLFLEANERCAEMIFSVQNYNQQYYGMAAHKVRGTNTAQGSGWTNHQITPYAVELYEKSDGTPFRWDDYISGYSSMEVAKREVYFLRDTLDASGNTLKIGTATNDDAAVMTRAVKTRLTSLGTTTAALYLPNGNEARVKAAYANRDPRLAANVITPYSTFRGNDNQTNQAFDFTLRFPFVDRLAKKYGDLWPDGGGRDNFVYLHRKFVNEGYDPNFNREWGATDDPMIRYADVLLMWAEALVEKDDLTGAQSKVEQVRDRVNMPTRPENFANQETARKYVRDERRREFLGEGVSFFDELRWKTLKQTKYTADNSHTTGIYADNVHLKWIWGIKGTMNFRWPDRLSGDRYVFPIPKSEIDKNPNLQKTPGWTY